MDEYLSEKEQIEQIRDWWRENGWYLIGGVVVAGIGYFGYAQYRAFKVEEASAASALYAEMQQLVEEDRPGVAALVDQLTADYANSPYADQARLLLARELLVSDPVRAASELRTVMETSADPELAMVARLRLARVLAYREQHDDALAILDVESPGRFGAQLKVIEGDIRVGQGDLAGARGAYTAALTMPGAEGLDRNLLQMKLSDIAPAADAAATEMAVEADIEAAPAVDDDDDDVAADMPAETAPTDDGSAVE